MTERRGPADEDTSAPRGAYLSAVVLASLVFQMAWFNRYAPPTSNGDVVAMVRWDGDFLPYRDYFFQAPPGMPILVRMLRSLGGAHLVTLLGFGVLLRTGAAAALHSLLARFVHPRSAAVATIAALFLSSTDISDTPFYYNHVGGACLVFSVAAALSALERNGASQYALAFVAGALAVFSVAVKQTMALAVLGAALAGLVVALPRGRGVTVRVSGGLVAGAICSVGSIWAWLASHGLTAAFVHTLRHAPEGKGGVGRSLSRPLTLVFDLPTQREVTLCAFGILAVICGLLWLLGRRPDSFARTRWLSLPLLLLVCGGLGLTSSGWDSRTLTLLLTALGWWGCLCIAIAQVPKLARAGEDRGARGRLGLGLWGFISGYSYAVSWPLFENMAFPSFAIAVAVLLEHVSVPALVGWRSWIHASVAVTAMLAGYRKESSPHSWGHWIEPPLGDPRGRTASELLRGVEVSDPTATLYAMVESASTSLTAPSDRIFVFPNMVILYAIAQRKPATFGLAHWVDTTPDFLGREDARRLREHPPKLLILRRDPVSSVLREEIRYRGGQPSSVRDVIDAIDAILPMYRRVGMHRTTASAPIEVFVRVDGV